MTKSEKIISGSLEAFIATDPKDIEASQKLRYNVFVEEMGAKASPEMKETKRDFDEFDEICDHLLVVDRDIDKIVGSYRILRKGKLPKGRKFYTESEYDISKLLEFKGEIMELGRSCVDKNYRDRSTMQLLWRAIGAYVNSYNVEIMFGCASFPSSNAKDHAEKLTYLANNHLAPEDIRPKAIAEHYTSMDMVATDSYEDKRVIASLPPLIKGYLRLGGYVGDGAYEDKEYNTTDVCIIVKTAVITQKYMAKYSDKK